MSTDRCPPGGVQVNFPQCQLVVARFLPLLRVKVGVLMPARFPAFDTIAKRGVPLSRESRSGRKFRCAKREAQSKAGFGLTVEWQTSEPSR